MEWFSVDKQGLAKLVERKGKEFIVFELLQNAWDERTSFVTASIKRIPGSPYVELQVTDDNPEGFRDLTHSFTLFAESYKKGDAEKRGRFNLGEKLVLALCRTATITSTKGSVTFDDKGRHTGRKTIPEGTIFRGELKLSDAEIAQIKNSVSLLLPPKGVETQVVTPGDLQNLSYKEPLAIVEETLPTEVADVDGNMRRSARKTAVEIHPKSMTHGAWLYEMGIPVVEIEGGEYSINVMQKVPLNFDRDNVSPSYLSKIHALTLEAVRDRLTEQDANSAWVKVAIQEQGDSLSDDTVRKIADLRFGENRVAYDPSDPEANNIAVTRDFKVIHGGSMSAQEWSVMRRAGAIQPAGQVTPSPKPFSPDGKPLRLLDESKWTVEMHRFVRYAKNLHDKLIGTGWSQIEVQIASDPTWPFGGCYGSRRLIVNYGRYGKKWFGDLAEINEFLIHEFGHYYSGNHLSEEYHDALTKLGAKLTQLALEDRNFFADYGFFEQHEEDASV